MSANTGLTVRGLVAGYRHGPDVVHGVDLTAPRGAITALMGPNGAGKSTALKAMVGLVPRARGSMQLDGADLAALGGPERARRVAYVPQRTLLTAPMRVRDVVAMGRFVHRGPWGRPGRADRAAIDAAMASAEIEPLADRTFPTLSGGEQQRVLLARALASGATALLLDEPTSALDVRHALLLHRALRALADDGAVIVVVLHDLSEARARVDQVVLLDAGRVAAAGEAAEVIAPAPVRAVYGVELIEGGGLGWRLPEAR